MYETYNLFLMKRFWQPFFLQSKRQGIVIFPKNIWFQIEGDTVYLIFIIASGAHHVRYIWIEQQLISLPERDGYSNCWKDKICQNLITHQMVLLECANLHGTEREVLVRVCIQIHIDPTCKCIVNTSATAIWGSEKRWIHLFQCSVHLADYERIHPFSEAFLNPPEIFGECFLVI